MTKYINKALVLAALAGGVLALQSCKSDPNSPGFEYMPDMYRSVGYESYSINPNFGDSLSARLPVSGTIPRNGMYTGYAPFTYANTPEEYERAGAELKNPLPFDKATVEEGKGVYNIMCVHCHGENGDGNGHLVAIGKFNGVPNYLAPNYVNLADGKMYFTLMYGKNAMGSHASQINERERWAVLRYVNYLQRGKKLEGDAPAAAPADSASAGKAIVPVKLAEVKK